jgi:hypothetical protein
VDLEGGIVAYSYAQPPAPRTRPTTVTVSSYLLYLVGAVGLVGAAVSLSVIGTMTDVYRDAYAGTTADGAEAVAVGLNVATVVINVVIAAGLAVLAMFNNRGRQGARITTWVVGGISVCCRGVGVLGSAATSSMNLDTGDGPSASQVERRLADALPSWYTPVTIALSVIALLAMLGAIILLALPASNAYFRRAPAGWDPSQQGYPAPGYPQYGAQSPYPAAAQQYPPNTGQAGSPGQPPDPSGPAAPPAPPAGSPSAETSPHTGSVPPTDPWSAPPSDDRPDRPPADPTTPA